MSRLKATKKILASIFVKLLRLSKNSTQEIDYDLKNVESPLSREPKQKEHLALYQLSVLLLITDTLPFPSFPSGSTCNLYYTFSAFFIPKVYLSYNSFYLIILILIFALSAQVSVLYCTF